MSGLFGAEIIVLPTANANATSPSAKTSHPCAPSPRVSVLRTPRIPGSTSEAPADGVSKPHFSDLPTDDTGPSSGIVKAHPTEQQPNSQGCQQTKSSHSAVNRPVSGRQCSQLWQAMDDHNRTPSGAAICKTSLSLALCVRVQSITRIPRRSWRKSSRKPKWIRLREPSKNCVMKFSRW